ncbi:DUF3515 domain-containing protein [Streptomyces sp. G45]|uniref:DUF3515 domain-containing protein n=1 Tax=Streptomyces sp. G45 TaxID=3406627 RepID=UPI003C1B3329
MNASRRLRSPLVPCSLALLIACAGCSSTDDGGTAAVPSPGSGVARLCRDLDGELPRKVNGLARHDPKPASPLTAGWGDPAIILRCGVPRPAKMNDPEADGVTVNGVGWLLQKRDDGSFRFTTTLRKAYVEVTIPEERTQDGVGPLTDFAAPIEKAIPKGIA